MSKPNLYTQVKKSLEQIFQVKKLRSIPFPSAPVAANKFLRINRSFFTNLGTTEPGWILNFDNDGIVLRKLEAASVPTIVAALNLSNSLMNIMEISGNTLIDDPTGVMSDVFNFTSPDYQDDNWSSMQDKSKVPFFYIDNALINSMDPDCNIFLLSPEVLPYTSSAIGVPPGDYDLIKIEARSFGNPQQTIGSHPVQAKVIFALPCPPEWNPAFINLPQPVGGGGGHK
jgi:hypothetical protein